MADNDDKTTLTCWQKTDRQCRAFANFFYNKQTGEVMGRSRASWGKIGLFYVVYYGFLAAFFSICLTVFLKTLNEPGKGAPKTIQFLMGDSAPGLNIVTDFARYDSSPANIKAVQDNIKKYLDGFNNAGYGSPCQLGAQKLGDKPCKFNQSLLGNCSGDTPGQDFGISTGKLCTFVKINKVYGWIPKQDNSDYLKLDCWAKGANSVTVVPEGYLVNAFPFRGESFYQTPPVAVIVDTDIDVTVHCQLKGKGVKTSETFIASRAFGKIKYTVSKKK